MEEHDRERMQAAIETADRLGLTPRLQRSIDLAKEEIDRLRGGLALEHQLGLDLTHGRSKLEGGGKWAKHPAPPRPTPLPRPTPTYTPPPPHLTAEPLLSVAGGRSTVPWLYLLWQVGAARSYGYTYYGRWAHGPIETAALEKSLAAATAFPLVSKAGVCLMPASRYRGLCLLWLYLQWRRCA